MLRNVHNMLRFGIFYRVIILLFVCQISFCDDVSINVIISPHDLSLEPDDIGDFKVYLSEAPDENVTIQLAIDHSGVAVLDSVNFTFNSELWTANVTVTGITAGKIVVTVNPLNSSNNSTSYNVDEAYVRVNIEVHAYLDVLASTFGWLYFACWVSVLYPQIYLNYRRKSVIGLSLDYIILNLLGTASYSIYNLGVYYIPEVKREYFSLHPYGIMPIQPQDIAFAVLSFCSTVVCGLQGLYYNPKTITVSKIGVGIVILGIIFLILSLIIAAVGVITWLDCLYYFSYLKLGISTIKYIPQVYSNYRHKSTRGWSVGFPILDFSGGSLSIMQMMLRAFNYNDWSSIFGNPTKFLLSLVCMFFDVVFFIQHFFVYRHGNSSPALIENESSCDDKEIEKESIIDMEIEKKSIIDKEIVKDNYSAIIDNQNEIGFNDLNKY